MKRIRVNVSRGEFFRINELQYAVTRVHYKVFVCVGDLLLIESSEYNNAEGDVNVLVREVIDIDWNVLVEEGIDCYDVFVRNNNYKS